MSSKKSHYSQALKLRWSMLLLATLVAFVLLANAHQAQQPPPNTVAMAGAETAEPSTPIVVAIVQPEYLPKALPERFIPTAVAIVQPEFRLPALPEHPAPTRTDSLSLLERTTAFLSGGNVAAPPVTGATRETVVIRNGDTLSGILDRFNVHSAMSLLLDMKKQIKPLLNLRPGRPIHLDIQNNRLVALSYERSPTEHFKLSLNGKKFTATNRTLEVEKQEAHAFGIIKTSFYEAALDVGLSDKAIIEIADILGWDIDFVLDVRAGDQFSVVYEKKYLDGEKLGDGNILALEFLNNGKKYRALRYVNADGKTGYFTPGGKSMHRPFIRNPIEYGRISSHFNPKRLHPIFKTVRPHRGVDYAANTGTPVRAAGDGIISFRGKKKGYGNVVIIKHGGKYSTLYAHLSKFARGQRSGSRVKQKQTIGYVGKTGYATGPHLHYEFRINNVHKNPLTVKLPTAKHLPKDKRAHFKATIAPELAKLDTLKRVYAAISPPE